MVTARSERTRKALELFAPLGPTYDRYAALLSFGQDPRWRRFLVSRVEAGPGDRVLDVATGTAAVAIALARRYGCAVTGVDQSPEMLEAGRARVSRAGLSGLITLELAPAEALPYSPASFDALTFTYLLRYVDDPGATLGALVRTVKPGGTVAALEFSIPRGVLTRRLWDVYVDVGLPLLGRAAGRGWDEVGSFLGGSIRAFYERVPLERLLRLFRDAGVADVRYRELSFGGGIVIWGRRGR